MLDDTIVCWNCHRIVDANIYDCPYCQAGVTPSVRNLTPEEFAQEQVELRRNYGTGDGLINGLTTCANCYRMFSASSDHCPRCHRPTHKPPVSEVLALETVGAAGRTDIVAPASPTCPHCHAVILDIGASFCPRCGERVVDEEDVELTRRIHAVVQADVRTLYQPEIARLERKIIRMEQRLLEQGTRPFSWQQVPDQEKWNLTWGVWGRQILVNIALMVGLFLILAAIAGSFGN